MKNTFKTLIVLLTASLAAFAQGPRGPQNQSNLNHTASVLNMAKH